MQEQVIIQDQNEFFTIAHKNTFSRIDIEILDLLNDKIRLRVLVSNKIWNVDRTKEQLHEIMRLTNSQNA